MKTRIAITVGTVITIPVCGTFCCTSAGSRNQRIVFCETFMGYAMMSELLDMRQ